MVDKWSIWILGHSTESGSSFKDCADKPYLGAVAFVDA